MRGRTRRAALALVGTAGLGSLAGCGRGRLSDFGGTGGSTVTFDGGGARAFEGALRTLEREPGSTLEIEPGTYRLGPGEPPADGPHHAHFTALDLENATIDGGGARLVFTDPTLGAMHFHGGSALAVRDLTVDYDPVPFTQGTVVDLAEDGRVVTLDLHEGYPLLDHDMFDAADQTYATTHAPDGSFVSGVRSIGSPDKRFSAVRPVGERRYELVLDERSRPRGLERGGNLAILARNGVAHAIRFNALQGLTVEDVTIHASPSFTLPVTFVQSPVVRNVTIAPPPDSNRLLSTDADGVHVKNATDGVTVEGCRLERLGDDGIVVDSVMATVDEVVDRRTVSLVDYGGVHVRPGDVLEPMSPQGERRDPLPPVDVVSYLSQYPRPWVPGRPDTVTFEAPIEGSIDAGDYLANQSFTSDDFIVRDNVVRETRANCVRLAADSGVVENNVLDGTPLHAVWIECYTRDNFVPKRWSNDVVIRNNTMIRSGLRYLAAGNCAAIQLVHQSAAGVSPRGRPHRSIEIRDNEIVDGAHLGMDLRHGRDVTVAGNAMRRLNQLDYEDGGFAVALDDVADVAIERNRVSGTAETLYQLGVKQGTDRVSASENELRIDGQTVEPRVVSWVPVVVAFDRTVRPRGSNRDLAFRCLDLALVDETGAVVAAVELGGPELPVRFGDGVYGVEHVSGETWRWFGGPDGTAMIDVAIADATRLRLRGKPIEPGIAATVSVGGQPVGRVSFDSDDIRVYELPLAAR